MLSIILVSGKRYAGKDVTADIIAAELSKTNKIIRGSFAEQLKQAYAEQHGLDYHRLMTDAAYKEEHRPGLIAMATEARALDTGVWVKRLLEPLRNVSEPTIVIVSDHRFPDEYETCKQFSTIIHRILVVSSSKIRHDRGWQFTAGVDDGPSECALDNSGPWAFVFHNHDNDLTRYKSIVTLSLKTIGVAR